VLETSIEAGFSRRVVKGQGLRAMLENFFLVLKMHASEFLLIININNKNKCPTKVGDEKPKAT
jgi:hypothetical protein